MVLGFMPLFFAGFLFTAGPKWLGVAPLEAPQLRAPLLLQALGWALWLAGGHLNLALALAGLASALGGLVWMFALFWQLIGRSQVPDRLHARTIGIAGLVGGLSLAGVGAAIALGELNIARGAVLTGLWGFIVVVYVAVAHRMIPFFTSSALPMMSVWRPFWVLWLMLGAAALEALAVWVELHGIPGRAWLLARGLVELAAGGVLLWLAVVWGLVQSMKIRLLAMLHIGFVWLGLAYGLAALSNLLGLASGTPVLGLGALHALAMGCLGSLMFAMVTRVACGHSGRALVADNLVWALFWVLQAAVVLRILGALPALAGWLIPLAASLWAVIVVVWGARLVAWMGRPRVDGKPG